MQRRRGVRIASAVTLAGALAATAGCGRTLTVGSDRTLRVALSEYRVNPQHALASPGPLTIVVRNYGRLTHNLSLTRDGQPAGSTKPLPPGGSARLTVSLARGTYVMASTILDDQALGEYGTLTVR